MIQWIYLLATGAGKMSVLAFYLRVFKGQSARFRYIIYGLMTFTTLSSLTMTLVLIFQCHPVHAFWTAMLGPPASRACLNPDILLYTSSGIIVATDVAVYVLPMKHLWRLSIPTRQKLQVMFLMGLGGLYISQIIPCRYLLTSTRTCVASAFRVYYLSVLVNSLDRNCRFIATLFWCHC
jgi:hypothetical protein